MLTTKDNVVIILALLIIYIGVYTLRAAVVDAAAKNTQWAGFFAITYGVTALLATIFGQGATRGNNVFVWVAGAALLASAYFHWKVIKDLPNGNFKYLLYGQVALHVLLAGAYVSDFASLEKRIDAFRASSAAAGLSNGISPRYPVRARQ